MLRVQALEKLVSSFSFLGESPRLSRKKKKKEGFKRFSARLCVCVRLKTLMLHRTTPDTTSMNEKKKKEAYSETSKIQDMKPIKHTQKKKKKKLLSVQKLNKQTVIRYSSAFRHYISYQQRKSPFFFSHTSQYYTRETTLHEPTNFHAGVAGNDQLFFQMCPKQSQSVCGKGGKKGEEKTIGNRTCKQPNKKNQKKKKRERTDAVTP